MDCIFCKIIKGEIPASKVYEDKDYIAFLDLRPVNKGHTLLIPKKHYRWVWDIGAESKELMAIAGKIANAIKKATGCHLVAMTVVGDEVEHAHLHLIPRFTDDGFKGWPGGKYEDGEMKKYKELIQKSL
jgi:histidine triad (HIT) family protein